jgi:predicted DNA-binding protein with PD1-like motif
MRVVQHAGPVLPGRFASAATSIATRDIVDLEAGVDLYTALEKTLDDCGTPGAAFNLLGGSMSELTIMTGGPGIDRPITFHGPLQVVTPVAVEAGSGIIGQDEYGRRFSHCHAIFRLVEGGLVGGHLIRGKAVVGTDGLRVELLALADACFVRREDPETGFAIFHPEAA